MVLNTRVKPALSRKQVSIKPVSNTGFKPHTGDPHQFNTSFYPTKLHQGTRTDVFSNPFIWYSCRHNIVIIQHVPFLQILQQLLFDWQFQHETSLVFFREFMTTGLSSCGDTFRVNCKNLIALFLKENELFFNIDCQVGVLI